MRNIKLTIEYDGTDFCGWQIQPNGITVQQCISDAIFALDGKKCQLNGAGRTDAGVHARGQVANFFTESGIPAQKYAVALNTNLPDSIRILDSCEMPYDFNARFSAKRKTYKYYIRNSQIPSALNCRYEYNVQAKLDVNKMIDACGFIIGEHDFKSFMAAGSAVKDTVRTIYDAKIDCELPIIVFTVTGNGFLYKMVRLLTGTLLEIGKGKYDVDYMSTLLNSDKKALFAAPAKGLFMHKIEYGEL